MMSEERMVSELLRRIHEGKDLGRRLVFDPVTKALRVSCPQGGLEADSDKFLLGAEDATMAAR